MREAVLSNVLLARYTLLQVFLALGSVGSAFLTVYSIRNLGADTTSIAILSALCLVMVSHAHPISRVVDHNGQLCYSMIDQSGQILSGYLVKEGMTGSMFSKFLSLEPEKRERIIKAALREFTKKGFDNASTNAIVKEADIAKGLLFHYFKSKNDLFRFLCDYVMEFLTGEYQTAFQGLQSGDIFERLKYITMYKVDLIRRHPEMYDFAVSILVKDNGKHRNDMLNTSKSFREALYKRLYEDLDTSNFKEGIDTAKALDIIQWSLDGYANRLLAQLKTVTIEWTDNERYLKEIDEYYDIIKRGIYK